MEAVWATVGAVVANVAERVDLPAALRLHSSHQGRQVDLQRPGEPVAPFQRPHPYHPSLHVNIWPDVVPRQSMERWFAFAGISKRTPPRVLSPGLRVPTPRSLD